MIIQHNLPAMNSHRNLGINNASTAKNLEKLSSGYRINRAGDDAAGLAISEKMRGQIRGLGMAEQNTSNAISLIQTAEGGLNETHAILQRMRELAVQSSNGTYDETVDRVQLQKEFQAIKEEIDRISESTHYNGIKLLDGSLGKNDRIPDVNIIQRDGQRITNSAVSSQVQTTATITFSGTEAVGNYLDNGDTVTIAWMDSAGTMRSASATYGTGATALQEFKDAMAAQFDNDVVLDWGTGDNAASKLTLVLTGKDEGKTDLALIGGVVTGTGTGTGTPGIATNTATIDAGVNPGTEAATITTYDGTSGDPSFAKYLEIDGKKFQFVSDPSQLETGATALFVDAEGIIATTDLKSIAAQLKNYGYNASVDTAGTSLVFSAGSSKGLTFQIGANGGADQRVSLFVDAMDSKSIGIMSADGKKLVTSLASAGVGTQELANQAIEIITAATNQVSGTRADLGALQNRLEHTMNNLGVTKENLTAAESTIRDVDMAKEMMEFTKNQILVQASQAMLAQANQLPQGVLNLLR